MIQRLGKYEIRGQIGRGGFGAVYEAFDPTVGRIVALKVLNAGGDANLIARFRAEATTAGNLQHRNIVTIHEFDEDQGTPFLVMEYLQGTDLQHIIKENKPLTLLEKMEIMSQTAQGLQYAHQHDVVHRDIKPANIMCLPDGLVKLMDFGIARLLRDISDRLTQTGFLMGTVQYMAPEQFQGGEADALSDIWAIGVVYYELLTGVHPFSGHDTPSTMYRISTEAPRPLADVLSGCPAGLDSVIDRLLQKGPSDRYQSLDDVLLDTQPIMRELSLAQVPELMQRASVMIEENDVKQAQSLVRKILEIDASNRQARVWRGELRERARNRKVRPKIEKLEPDADEEQTKLNNPEPAPAEVLCPKAGEEEQDRINSGIGESQDLMKHGEYEKALELLEDLDRRSPDNALIGPSLAHARDQAQIHRDNARIEEFARQALAASEARDFARALLIIRRVLEESPDNQRILKVNQSVLEAQRFEQQRRALVDGLTRVHVLCEKENLEQAAALVEQLATEHPENFGVMRAREDVQNRIQARDEKHRSAIQKSIGETERLMREGQVNAATRLLDKLTVLHPAEHELHSLLDRSRALEREEREHLAINAILASSNELVAHNKWMEAGDVLAQGLLEYPNSSGLLEASGRIRDQQAVDADIAAIEHQLSRSDFDRAIALAEAAQLRVPSESRIGSLLSQARDARELEQITYYANQRLIAGGVDDAEKILANAPARFAKNPELLGLAGRIATIRSRRHGVGGAASELRERFDREHGEFEALLRADRFADAIRKLEAMIRNYPEEGYLTEELRQTRQRQDEYIRMQKLAQGKSEAENLLSQDQLDDAVQKLRALLKEYPGDSSLTANLQRVTAGIKVREERSMVDAGIEELNELFERGDAEGVRAGAQTIDEAAEIRARTDKEPRSKALWVTLAAGLVIVVASVVFWLRNKPEDSVQFDLRPSELIFTYKKGGVPPDARSFLINVDGRSKAWSISGSEPWLLITPNQGRGSAIPLVRVYPSQLSPGEYSGAVTITFGDKPSESKILRLQLRVEPNPGFSPSNVAAPKKSRVSQENQIDEFSRVMPGIPVPGNPLAGKNIPLAAVSRLSATYFSRTLPRIVIPIW